MTLTLVGLLTLGAPANDLQALDRALVQAETQVLALEAQREKIIPNLAEIDAASAVMKVHAQEVLEELQVRLRALVRVPALARLLLLSKTDSLSEYVRDRRVLKMVAKHDHALHQRYAQENTRLQALAQTAQAQKQTLTRLAQEQRQLRNDIAQRRQARVAVVQALVAEPGRAKQNLDASTKALEKNLNRLLPSSRGALFAAHKGKLPWPTMGAVAAQFGQAVELGYGTLILHNGWDIAAKAGERVQAVAQGAVAFVDYLPGYGQVVIVDHGDDYHTVMAHLASVAVKAGDKVDAGATLGTVGDTGSLRGTLLYFEIRHRGQPQDPTNYLRR